LSVHCYTSITFSYLNRARVLGETLKRHHPTWVLWLLITDKAPPGFTFLIENEPWDKVVYAEELGLDRFENWLFRHDLVEACTAVKGPFMELLLQQSDVEKVFYLDPDIALLAPLTPLVDMLDTSSILLTPHQLEPDEVFQAIIDNEICSLAHGTYNLGFVAVANSDDGPRFASWWAKRLLQFCFDKKDQGLFVDQKWCDLAPGFFDGVRIVRDPGYNVASWNLSQRRLGVSKSGEFTVNEAYRLRFFHFTKLGPIADEMTRRYAADNVEVYEVWHWYKRQIEKATDASLHPKYWHYSNYSSGKPIPKKAREIFRHRVDLQHAFPDPFDSSNGGYEAWYNQNM
jgi:hypothetical protein